MSEVFHPGLLEDFVAKGIYLEEYLLKKWLKFDYDVYEGIHVDFFNIAL